MQFFRRLFLLALFLHFLVNPALAQPALLSDNLSLNGVSMFWKNENPEFYKSRLTLIPDSLTGYIYGGYFNNPVADFKTGDYSLQEEIEGQTLNIVYKLNSFLFLHAGMNHLVHYNKVAWDSSYIQMEHNRRNYPLALTIGPGPFMSFGDYYFWAQFSLIDARGKNYEYILRLGKQKLFQLELSYVHDKYQEDIIVNENYLDTISPLNAVYPIDNSQLKLFYLLNTSYVELMAKILRNISEPGKSGNKYWTQDSTESYEVGVGLELEKGFLKGLSLVNAFGIGETKLMGLRELNPSEVIRYHYHPMDFYSNFSALEYFKTINKAHGLAASINYYYYNNSGGQPYSRDGRAFFNYKRFNPDWFGIGGLITYDYFEIVEHDFYWDRVQLELRYQLSKENWGAGFKLPLSYHQMELEYNWSSISGSKLDHDTVEKKGNWYFENWRLSSEFSPWVRFGRLTLLAKVQYAFSIFSSANFNYSGVVEDLNKNNINFEGKPDILKNGLFLGGYGKIDF